MKTKNATKISLILLFVFSLISLKSSAQKFEWVKQYRGFFFHFCSAYPVLRDGQTKFDKNNNLVTMSSICTGVSIVGTNSNIEHALNNNSRILISKFTSSGNLMWLKSVNTNGSGFAKLGSFDFDENNNIYITGLFHGTVDFDPDPSVVYNLTSAINLNSFFLCKLNKDGNFLWAKSFSNLDTVTPTEHSRNGCFGGRIIIHGSDCYIAGGFQGTVDFDFSSGSQLLYGGYGDFGQGTYLYWQDVFVLNIDTAGNFKWVNSYNGWNDDTVYDYDAFIRSFDLDIFGNLNLIYNSGMVDREHRKISALNGLELPTDSLPGKELCISDRLGNLYCSKINGYFNNRILSIRKYDNTGNYIWEKNIGRTIYHYKNFSINAIKADSLCNIYVVGTFDGVNDFDPNVSIYNLKATGYWDVFIIKLDSLGSLLWARSIGGASKSEEVMSIEVDSHENIYITGIAKSSAVDVDPTALSYTIGVDSTEIETLFLLKLNKDSCAQLTIIFDSVADASCAYPGYISANVHGSYSTCGYNWSPTSSINNILTVDSSGIYTLIVNDSLGCSTQRSVLINGPDFAIAPSFDLKVNLFASGFRNGFNSTIFLDAFNGGCTPINAQLKFVVDNQLIISAINPLPDLQIGDTIIWNLQNITFDSTHFCPIVTTFSPIGLPLGCLLHFELLISPTFGDVDTLNNKKEYQFIVRNSWDPNDITVDPQGACDANYILNGDKLTYTIRFQNTGNAEAINILVIDTLSTYLNVNTLKVIKSSFPVTTEIDNNQILKFMFKNINLPDSTSNLSGSHGYIVFEIEQKNNIPNYTQLINKAQLYFDSNPAISTNGTINTVVNNIPTCIENIEKNIFQEEIQIYPNPNAGFFTIKSAIEGNYTIINHFGQTLRTFQLNANNNKTIKMEGLNNGVYMIIGNNKQKIRQKVIIAK